MIIFITDEGRYWNHENPILERYADCVRVICLNGEAVTDKYKCIVSPYKPFPHLGMTDYSVLSLKYKALKSIENKIREEYFYHDDIVFLADQEPRSLFPYLVLKDNEEYNKMHLWCMLPWKFESKQRRDIYYELLHDIDKLSSILFVDPDEFLASLEKRTTIAEAIDQSREWCNSMLPSVLFEIDSKLRWGRRYYYDLKVKRYIRTDDPYSMVLKVKPINKKDADEFVPFQGFSTLGSMCEPLYPDPDDEIKDIVEQLHPRFDGKKVCEKLKQMRIQLAEANGIDLETVDCPSTGPCAGTCPRCDMELRYLQEQLLNKKANDREYPFVDIESKGVKSNLPFKESGVLQGFQMPIQKNQNETANGSGGVKIPEFLKVKTKETNDGEADE